MELKPIDPEVEDSHPFGCGCITIGIACFAILAFCILLVLLK